MEVLRLGQPRPENTVASRFVRSSICQIFLRISRGIMGRVMRDT